MGSQALPPHLLWHGLLSPLVRRSWQEPAPARAPHGVTASFTYPPAPAWGPFPRVQVDICSTVDLHGLQGDNLPHRGLHHEQQGKTAPASQAPPPPPSSLTLVSAELFLSHCLTPLSQLPSYHRFVFFFVSLLKYVIPEALPIGLDLASRGSVLELAGTGFVRHGGSFWQLLTEATPIVPLLPKPITRLYYIQPK